MAPGRQPDGRAVRAGWLVVAAAFLLAACPVAAAAPASDLAAEARGLAEAAKRHYGEGYVTRIDNTRHVVYVSAVDAQVLDRVMTLLGEYADAQGLLLFPNALPWNMTVVLPTVDDYRRSMPLSRAVGRYENATRTLESISVSDVLFHEFTHGLHHGDQVAAGQRHAPWVVEGLASLFQRCTVRKGRIEVQPGSDLVALQDAVRDKKVHPLTELAAMDHKTFMEDAATCYMQARYVMFQLYREGKLRAFYEIYKADYVADPTGMKSLAKTLGKPIKDVDADWRRWVLAQEPPWTPARPPKAHLGVRMGPADGGVRVTGFAPGSAAERAGVLKVNDVIISVAGQATPASRDIVFAVQLCQPGQTVDIEVIRDGRAMTVRQLLGHMME